MSWRFGLLWSMKVKSLRAVSLWKTGAVDKVPGFFSGQAVTRNSSAPFNSRFASLRIQTWPSIRFSFRVSCHKSDCLGMKRVGPHQMLPDGNRKPFALLVVDMWKLVGRGLCPNIKKTWSPVPRPDGPEPAPVWRNCCLRGILPSTSRPWPGSCSTGWQATSCCSSRVPHLLWSSSP